MKLSTLLCLCTLLFCACQSSPSDQVNNSPAVSTEQPTVIDEKLSVAAFKEKLDAITGQLIDVRTPEEFEAGYIAGAVNLNFYEDNFEQQLLELDKEKAVFVYCRSGGRSGKTSNRLKTLGFKEIYDLKGGYTEWAK